MVGYRIILADWIDTFIIEFLGGYGLGSKAIFIMLST